MKFAAFDGRDVYMSCARADLSKAEALPTLAVTNASFREAMSRLPAGVTIVTTDGPAGRAGFTATAVCSVTDSPPSLLVCINRSRSAYEATIRNGVLAVNALAPEHQELATLFGGKTSVEHRFAAAQWQTGETGAPLLAGAPAAFDCRISRAVDAGGHAVLICEIVGVAGLTRSEGLVYFHRNYHGLNGEPTNSR